MTASVESLLGRLRTWRAEVPFGRRFEVVARPRSGGTEWMVGVWETAGREGEVRAIVHHAPDLLSALERAVSDLDDGVLTTARPSRPPWDRTDPT